MATTILRTKLFIPPLREHLVPRPRLIEHLNRGVNSKLILISAPAGFGKTTLVSHWLQQQTKPVAWLALDENDNVTRRFFTYLLAAVQTVYPELGQSLAASLHSTHPPEDESVIPALVNELAADDRPLILVLDDYHVIKNQMIHEACEFLVNYMPAAIQLVITSREDPDLPLPRWRVRGHITEVRAADLRFSVEEATAFFQDTMGLSLDETAVSTLESRTEGWIAGLQLAALSIRHGGDAIRFVAEFTGDDRQVTDYLLQEVLLQQPESVQQFLLRTSILERFNANLCDFLLEETNSQDILDQLDSSNLFLIPLDTHRYWYRYHHLFAQLLTSRLERDLSETAVAQLHRRAANWYESQGLLAEAIIQARQIPDDIYTACLLSSVEMHTLFEQDGTSLILQWAQDLPVEIIQKYPRIALLAAGAHLLVGAIRQTEHYLAIITDDETTVAEKSLFQSILLRNRSSNYEEALVLAQTSLDLLSESERNLRAMARMQIAVNQYQLGQLNAAEQTILDMRNQLAFGESTTLGMALQAIHMLAGLKITQGELFRAEQLCLEGLTLSDESSEKSNPFVGLLYARLAQIYYEWNDLDRIQAYWEIVKNWAKRTGISDILIEANILQANLACWRQDASLLSEALEALRQLSESSRMESVIEMFGVWNAHFSWRFGDLETAVRWANASRLSLTDNPTFDKAFSYENLAMIRLLELRSLGEKRGVSSILELSEKMIQFAKTVDDIHGVISNLCIKAMAHDWQGEVPLALATLEEALTLAERGSMVRTFVDFGQPMKSLLTRALSANPAYVGHLLKAFDDEKTAVSSETLQETPSIHLTDRETDVLNAIAAGLSNKEIEAALVISNNTVRTHIKNLYSKLGVESRTQAIVRAQELNLLSFPQ